MKTSPLTRVLLLAVVVSLWAGCKSSPQVRPFDIKSNSSSTDLLDAPVKPHKQRVKTSGSSDNALFVVPQAPKDLSKKIDGKDNDWDTKKFRTFASKSDIEAGPEFWSGPADASFKVGVSADEGYLYFFIDVRDDHVVVNPSDGRVTDGVVLWLRDPKLQTLLDGLPKSAGLKDVVHPETAILFTPDGHYRRYAGDDSGIQGNAVTVAARRHKGGYSLEMALRLSVFQQISAIPLSQVAFRVDLLDGDEPSRPGVQTRMSMLPKHGPDSPRFALFDVGGILPHQTVHGQPPRVDALGRWVLGPRGWSFRSLEVVPNNWVVYSDVKDFETALLKANTLENLCSKANHDVHLVEAYESRNHQHRAGLVVCGSRTVHRRCHRDAETHVFWVDLKHKSGHDWKVDTAVDVFGRALKQCADKPRRGQPFYNQFSLFPVEVVSNHVWVIGWTSTQKTPGEKQVKRGVQFINSDSANRRIGNVRTTYIDTTRYRRSVDKGQVFLTPVDSVSGLDICEVEHDEQESCRGFDRDCHPLPHKTEVLNHILMWNPDKQRFETYLLTKHRHCSADFDFAKVKGFMLLHVNNRVGLLPSPNTL